jgi:hypothetical protein
MCRALGTEGLLAGIDGLSFVAFGVDDVASLVEVLGSTGDEVFAVVAFDRCKEDIMSEAADPGTARGFGFSVI